MNGVVTYYLGKYYEKTVQNGHYAEKKHYSAGSSIIAVRTVIDGTQDTLNWLVGDHLGSTSLVTDSAGAVVSEVRYSAFGEMRYLNGETVTDLLYTGQKLEELGLYYYVARWYDPNLSRFLSPDSIITDKGSSTGYDRYAYVDNNPVKYTDPTGHMRTDGCDYEGCDVSSLQEYMEVAQYTLYDRFIASRYQENGFIDKALDKIYSYDNPLTRYAIVNWASSRIGGPNTNQALVDLAYILGDNLANGLMGLAMGGDVTAVNLYAFGNTTGPRPPRLGIDIASDEFGYVGPEFPPLPDGASTFGDPNLAPLTGQYHELPAGSQLPDGLSVVADGVDINPSYTNPASHYTIYPNRPMSFSEFVEKFLSLSWVHVGKK